MPTYRATEALPNGEPGPWGEAVEISYDQARRAALRGRHRQPRSTLRLRGPSRIRRFPPPSPSAGGALAHRLTATSCQIRRDPSTSTPSGTWNWSSAAEIRFRLRPIARDRHPSPWPRQRLRRVRKHVTDGDVYVKMVNGSFRRGVRELGDIQPFEGAGQTYSQKITVPEREPDVIVTHRIADNQAHVYRLSGDYNPLHIDPDSARFGGFHEPSLHGLCTFGHCAQLLLGALADGDPARFRKIKVRFSAPVFLNDELNVRAWARRRRSGGLRDKGRRSGSGLERLLRVRGPRTGIRSLKTPARQGNVGTTSVQDPRRGTASPPASPLRLSRGFTGGSVGGTLSVSARSWPLDPSACSVRRSPRRSFSAGSAPMP